MNLKGVQIANLPADAARRLHGQTITLNVGSRGERSFLVMIGDVGEERAIVRLLPLAKEKS